MKIRYSVFLLISFFCCLPKSPFAEPQFGGLVQFILHLKPPCGPCEGCGDSGCGGMPGSGEGGPNGSKARRNLIRGPQRVPPGKAPAKEQKLDEEYPDYGTWGMTNAPVSLPAQINSGVDACGDNLVGLITVMGRYHLFRVDMSIPGRGDLDWRFSRTYMQDKSAGSTDGFFDTRFGNGWGFPYMNRMDLQSAPSQVSIFESGRLGGVYWYDYNNNGSYNDGDTQAGEPDMPSGENRRLFRNQDDSYDFVELNGTTWHYEPDATVPGSGRLAWIRDRMGNTMDFIHGETHPSEAPAPADALTTVIDPLGRTITYHYYFAPGQAKDGKLWKVRDFLGREAVFDYDANGNLVSARSPVVTETYSGGTNTFPTGRTEVYGYTQLPNWDLWLLSTITRPNENDPNHGAEPDGTFLVENHYFADPASAEIRIEWQKRGPTADVFGSSVGNQLDFEYLEYTSPQWTDPANLDPNLEEYPDLRMAVTDRNGNQLVYWTSTVFQGLSRAEILETDVLDGTGPPAAKTLVTRYKYLNSFQVEKITYPNGRRVEFVYETETHPMTPVGSNPIQVTEFPGVTEDLVTGAAISNAQPSRTRLYTFEPIFNLALSATDELGNTTRYYYDFMEGDSFAVADLASQYRRVLDAGQIAALALDTDLNGDGSTYQQKGMAIRIEEETVSLDPSSPQVAIQGDTTQEIFHLTVYDDFGQAIFTVDPEGIIDQYLYYPETDPDGDGTPTTIHPFDPTPPGDPVTGGWLREIVRDIPLAASGLSGSVLPPKHQTAAEVEASTLYEWSPAGNLTRTTNPNGIVYESFYNELDEIYRELSAVGAAEEQETRFEYDANGNVIRSFVKNTVSEAGPWVETQTDFDLQDRQIASRAEITQSGGTPVFAETKLGLDGNGNLVRLQKPQGNETSWSYNARNKSVFMRRGTLADPENARSESFYDSAGNLVSSAQHTEGVSDTLLQNFTLFDGYDRSVGSVDPVGTRTSRLLDAVGNAVFEEVRGYLNGPSPNDNTGVYNPLRQTYTDYDERYRPFRVRHQLLNDAGHATGDGNGQIVQQSAFDRLGRQTWHIEHPVDGDTSKIYRSEYDGRSRVVKRTDPAGNTVVHVYDANDNLVETVETDVASVSGFPAETFTTTLYYDALDRQIQVADNLGNTRRMQYDGQDNVIFASDANGPLPELLPRRTPELGTYIANLHGNVTHFTYDGLSRLKEKRVRMTQTGRGDGTTTPPLDTTQAGDGYITVTSVWDMNSRLVQQIDDAGNVTQYSYDALDRKIVATYALGTAAQTNESWIYDGADRLIKTVDQNGTQVESVYDLASRLATKSLLVAGSGVSLTGTLSQSFEWDGLGRLTKAIDDNGGTPVSFDRAYDSLGRVYIENQSIGGSTLTSEAFWKGEGLRWNFLFPNGRSLQSSFDNMNRLDTLDGNIGYEYVGAGRILDRVYPNGTKLTYRDGLTMTGYDGARRIVHQKWTGPSSSVLADFEYTHDREGRRKTARRLHQLNGSNQPKGEFYSYDSAYRLTDWKESWVQPDPLVIPAGGGTFTFSGSGSATISVVQTGGFPIATQVRSVVGAATDSQNWTLDGVGNWQEMKRKGTATSTAISEHNAYTSWGGTAQIYDVNGNLADDGVYLYQYDFVNRLRNVTLKATQVVIASYEYDAMNRRVTKTVESVTTRYLYDGWHAIEERVSESVTKQFVYGQSTDEILKMDTYASGEIDETYYYHADPLGSVVALTDESGAIVERVKYSPYGQPYWMNALSQLLLDGSGNYVNASTVGNPLLFTAARYDAETASRTNSQITDATGAYYMRNRYMDADKGRFITRDPIGIWGDGVNLGGGYAYCGNDPINCKDPSGLKAKKCKDDEEKEKEKEKLKKRIKIKTSKSDPDGKLAEAILDALLNTPTGLDLLKAMDALNMELTFSVDFGAPGGGGTFDQKTGHISIDPYSKAALSVLEGSVPKTPESSLAIAASVLGHEISHALDKATNGDWQMMVNGRIVDPSERLDSDLSQNAAIRVQNQILKDLGFSASRVVTGYYSHPHPSVHRFPISTSWPKGK